MGQPGDRAAAPGGLALVQSFVNSVNVEHGPDEFETTDGLARWLGRNGFTAADLGEPDRRDAVALREALRSLLRENNGAEQDTAAHRVVEHVARDCPLVLRVGAGGIALGPAHDDVRGALGAVLAKVAEAATDGSWQRLKACQEHRCEWAFYDRSRNRASRWCSMQVCGTRAKMRVYRQGKREQGDQG
ncbi:CGNR zinc finger domain-containing protein [Actinokineospora pegani]|uniref:CGNR zinc finger domain-containing protein n=1 Tax=Actinokineospora pegani TaxID=2654637 RepID=UPI0012EAC002|nr:CGNR zinc finger domain-containing protein [Actinokineospora pegani]